MTNNHQPERRNRMQNLNHVEQASEELKNEKQLLGIQTDRELFRFESHEDWVNNAKWKFDEANLNTLDTICIDAKGVVCRIGHQFQKATENESYPIIAYELT